MNIGSHFTLADLCRSATATKLGLSNEPTDGELRNLVNLGLVIMDPLWSLLGGYHLNSGYRSPAVNVAAGSKAKHSAHMAGRAVDITPQSVLVAPTVALKHKALRDAFAKIKDSPIPYDQLIIEADRWLHVAIAAPGVKPRRQALVGVLQGCVMKYLPG